MSHRQSPADSPDMPAARGVVDVDALVVGAGAVGLYAAYYAAPDPKEPLFPGHSSDLRPAAA